jgi:hypothetical protein
MAVRRRLRDKAHLKFVASQPCLICGRNPADAHHLGFNQPRAMGLKMSDEFTVPRAESIAATSVAMETKSLSGNDERSIPLQQRGCSGFRRGVLNRS